jgi:hypothetical protein
LVLDLDLAVAGIGALYPYSAAAAVVATEALCRYDAVGVAAVTGAAAAVVRVAVLLDPHFLPYGEYVARLDFWLAVAATVARYEYEAVDAEAVVTGVTSLTAVADMTVSLEGPHFLPKGE